VRIYSLSREEKKSVSYFIGAFLPKTKLVQQFQVKQRRQNVLKVECRGREGVQRTLGSSWATVVWFSGDGGGMFQEKSIMGRRIVGSCLDEH